VILKLETSLPIEVSSFYTLSKLFTGAKSETFAQRFIRTLCGAGDYILKVYNKNESNKDNPKSIEELKTWAQTEIVKDYCERYAYVKTIQNETKQQKELSRVENSRMLYVPQLVRNIIEDNDLPDSYADELFYYVDAEINKCQ
ncbi:hypothetical protein, partial [Flavobacterium collinsii]|uniref:hypothetical protein n=1 Tax=Flavobacterium collinsii TaxID=1114861 RepID=UPI0024919271